MSLRSQSVTGVKWNAVGTLTTTALQMLKLFILARILTKQDFGLLAIATMFLGFTEIFANMGLATGIIHRHHPRPILVGLLAKFDAQRGLVAAALCLYARDSKLLPSTRLETADSVAVIHTCDRLFWQNVLHTED